VIRLWWLGLIASCGCGGGWAEADTKSATSAVKDELLIEAICAPDAGACTPSQVRALERAALCNNESMLLRHGKPVDLDGGGISCQP
jgi:hypothetical protein